MANDEHVALLKQGVAAWNTWRDENANITPDLSEANLHEANLYEANLSGANLGGARLSGANLGWAQLVETNLSRADLTRANLIGAILHKAILHKTNLSEANLYEANLLQALLNEANLSGAKLRGARLSGASLGWANLGGANLGGADLGGAILHSASLYEANLSGANLGGANLGGADLGGAILHRASLYGAILRGANLNGANLNGADLSEAILVRTDFMGADLTGCRIYGVSAWNLKLEGAKQQNLVITPDNEPAITVDNIEVAQFIYLLLHNQKIRDVIDTVTSKAVLILGRFTDERKAVLDALREELRNRNLLPILFDFAIPASRDVTETIKTLASLARFVIADVTDATEVRVELHNIVPDFTSLPIQLILLRGHAEFVSLSHLTNFPWVLPIFEYDDREHLLASLDKSIVSPAVDAARKLRS
jgi:uncharacterized protein YjbI with pentapeptide repeats